MRRLLLTTTLLALPMHHAFAQPIFTPLAQTDMVVKTEAAPAAQQPAAGTTAPAPIAPQDSFIQAPVSRSGEVIESKGSGAIPALPLEVVRQGNMAYITGGVGDEEVAQLKAQEHLYNFRVQITNSVGEYLSDVTFKLYDNNGKELLTINDAGPYVMMQLPFGKFQAEAISKSVGSKKVDVRLPAGKVQKTQIRL